MITIIFLKIEQNKLQLEITKYLKSTDRMAKTIVFCPTEEAAERMRIALVNHNADRVKDNPDYVFGLLVVRTMEKVNLIILFPYLRPYPVIATTSKLLSTVLIVR